MFNILVVDDSQAVRESLKKTLFELDEVSDIYLASCAKDAYHIIENKPIDIVLMDYYMPEINGLEASRKIYSQKRIPIILVTSADKEIVLKIFNSMENYCIDYLLKSDDLDSPEFKNTLKEKMLIIKGLNKKAQNSFSNKDILIPDKIQKHENISQVDNVNIFVISAGGPKILKHLLMLIEPALSPIILVQHIESNIFEYFYKFLQDNSSKPIKQVYNNQPFTNTNQIFVLNPNYITTLKLNSHIYFSTTLGKSIYSPPADPIIKAAAEIFKEKLNLFVFTGMAHDALEGAKYVKLYGGKIYCQHPDEAFISTMIKKIDETVGCDNFFYLNNILEYII